MNINENIESLISRFLNGECTAEEQSELVAWIEQSPSNTNEYFRIKDTWDFLNAPRESAGEQLALFYKNQYAKAQTSRIIWIRSLSAVAAVLLVGLLVSILMPSQSDVKPTGNLQVFSVPLGSRSKVVLADGSIVNLNSGSELRCPSSFSTSNREVNLSGEAFFNVKTDKEHPFIVKTKDFDLKVTGTKFNVCSYNDNNFATTTLAEGIISLKMNSNPELLKVEPGIKFQLNRKSNEHTLAEADIESEIAWKDDQFIFKNIPFPELAKRLERWYDVKLNYSDIRLQNYNFTGKFKNQETIWQVLDALTLTSPIDYTKKSFREFTITYKPLNMN
jgi:ferric-dicitrate binding protein FerR (iron transport regulator)